MDKILLIVPCIQFGGTETVAIRYYHQLKKENKKVSILSIVSSTYLPSSVSYIFSQNSFFYKLLSLSLLRPFFYLYISLNCFKFIKNNQSIISFGELPIFASSPYAFLYKYFFKKNKKFVCSFRNHPSTLNKYKINLLIFLMNNFDSITANSIAAKNFFNKRIKKNNIYMLFNPFPYQENYSKKIKKDSFFNILSVARLEKQKNIFFLIDSFNQKYKLEDKLQDFKLHIVGEGNEINRLQNYVISNNLSNNIIFYGQLSQQKVFNMYQFCDLFVHSSKWDGIPNTVLEALYFNLPVLSYKSTKSGINDLSEIGAPIHYFKEFNSNDFFKEIYKCRTLSFYDNFLKKNKIFLESYKQQSSILNLLKL